MGGGEVARYFGRYGSERAKNAAFISAIPPYLLKAADNPEGIEGSVFVEMERAIAADRFAFAADFTARFYNADDLLGTRVSEHVVQHCRNIAATASPSGTYQAVSAWQTDFRKDLACIDVPTLVVHGEEDRIVPLDASSRRTAKLVPGSRLSIIGGAPHGLIWTHAAEFNPMLLDFLRWGRADERG